MKAPIRKIGRNDCCPCGSGKKYKQCHLGIDLHKPHTVILPEGFTKDRVQSLYVDHKNRRNIIVSNDVLTNQLTRDVPKIAASFDVVAEDEFVAANTVFSAACGIIFSSAFSDLGRPRDILPTCSRLLLYALESYSASVHLARGGFRRQFGIVARSVIETLAIVIQLCTDPNAISLFNLERLSSSKSVNWANKIIPGFGRIWGHLSNDFVYIGEFHNQILRLNEYDKKDESLTFILPAMKMYAWLLHIVAELVFHENISQLTYWTKTGEGTNGVYLSFAPSEAVRLWMKDLLKTEDEHE